jgi:hypothetical protein
MPFDWLAIPRCRAKRGQAASMICGKGDISLGESEDLETAWVGIRGQEYEKNDDRRSNCCFILRFSSREI